MVISRHARMIVGVFLSTILIAGCGTPGQTLQLRQNELDISTHREIESTPFFPQLDYYCGPATLATMANFHNRPAKPEDIASLIYVPELKGSLQEEMIAATRQYDLLPVLLDGRLESLFREIDSGNPVLVLQNLGLDTLPNWHYAIVVGYDLKSETIVLRSGSHRRLSRPFSLFERTWQRANNWALVIVPPGTIPVTADAESYLSMLVDFEQTGDRNLAHQSYVSAAKKWPSQLLAQAGVGNTAYSLGKFKIAEAAYRKALVLSPELDQLWNNLAYSLAQQGKMEEAIGAIEHAIDIAPDNANYRHSASEISAWPAH